MACKIDETVKLIDELIESEQWTKYNKKSGLPEDNKKLKEAIAKLDAFKSLKMKSQSTTPGYNDTETSRENRFNKYISDVFTDELYNDITQLVKDNKLNDAAGKITGTYNRIGLNDNYEYEDNVDTDNLRDDVREHVSKSIASSVLNDTTKLTQNMINKLFKKTPGRNYEIQPGITASEGQKKLIDKGIEFLQNEKKASKIGENVMIVQGRGGTGKTSSISRVLINYINENSNSSGRKTPNILMMTLSHQAKDVLKGMSKQIFEETRVQPKVEVIAGAMAWYATDDDIKSKSIVFEDKKISYKNKDKNIDGVYKSSVASAVNGDIIVVDEASMLDSAELAYLLEKTKDGVKVILMGDYHQTKIVDPKTGDFSVSGSINTGYSKVFDHFTGVKDPLLKNAEVVELTEIHRQKEGSNILDFADYYADTVDYGLGNIKIKPTVPIANGNEVKYINRSDIVDSFVSDYNKGKNVVYIAHSNKDVTVVNKHIRQKLSKNPKDEYSVGDMMIAYSNYIIDGDGPIITNSERLIIKKIDDATKEEKSKEKISQKVGFATQEFKYKENVKLKKLTLERVNGDYNSMPLVVFVPSGLLNSVISKFEANTNAGKNFDTLYKDELIRFFEPTNNTKSTKTPTIRKDSLTSVSAGAGLSYGYAVTAHKSQGSTVDIVYTTLSSDPNVSYVAVTRAREKVYIVDNAKANNSSSNSVNNTVESKNDSTTTPGSESKVKEQKTKNDSTLEEEVEYFNNKNITNGTKNKDIREFMQAGIRDKVRDIKISEKDLNTLKKENDELIIKTGVSTKWIANDSNADFNYDTKENSVTYVKGFNDTITTVLQNHELKHALTFKFLKDKINDPKVKELIKSVNDFKDRLTDKRYLTSKIKNKESQEYLAKTNDLYERVEYMLEKSTSDGISDDLRQVSEIVAILSSEKDIREQFLNEFKDKEKSRLKVIIDWIKSKLSFKEIKTEYSFSPKNIVYTVDTIVKQSKQSYKQFSKDDIDVDAELKEKIKSRLSETYKNVDLSKITLASSNAAINFLNNNSIENVPYQYADVYIDVLRNTTFVNNTINNISKYKNISIVDAEKLLIESIGKNYIEYFKNGIGDKYIASYARKIWNFILDFFGKFDNTINEINIISERFFNGENSDAISYYPKKGFEKVNTELTFKDQPFAGNVLKTVVSSNKSISFTGSASLALQGDIYRKGKNGITDLHDLDFIVHGEKALDAAKREIFKNFSAFEIYDFGLSNGRTERISTLIVVPKEYKIPRNSIQRNKNLRVISYKIYDSENNVVGTYNATVDNNGQIESENTTGFKAVIVDLMQESKDESEGTIYYSDTLKTEVKLANPDDVFKAKNDIGKDIPRNKDILDSTSFYKSNRYKQFSKDDIEAAKDIMAKNKKECE